MSIWNRIGQLATDVKDYAEHLVGAASGVPKFVWDVATAPWNDNEEFNGFTNTLKSAGKDLAEKAMPLAKDVLGAVSNVSEAPVVKPILEGIVTLNREVVREPLTTAQLMKAEGKSLLDTKSWQEAYGQAQTTSYGQSLIGAYASVIPGEQAVDHLDWTNPEEVKKFYSTGANKFWSGFADFNIQVFGDLTIAAGKAAKIARASEYVTNSLQISNTEKAAQRSMQAINDVADAGAGVQNKYSPLLTNFATKSSAYAYNHPMIKGSPMRDTLSFALGEAKTEQDAALVLRAGLGDTRALAEITAKRGDIGDAMNRQMGVLDSYQEMMLARRSILDGMDVKFKNHEEFMNEVTKLPHEDQTVVNSTLKYLEDLRKQDTKFAEWEKMASIPGGVLKRTVGVEKAQGVANFMAEARSIPGATARQVLSYTRPDISVWQPTPFHKMVQIINLPLHERPAGIVNLNDPDSSREVSAFVDRGLKLGAIDGDMAEKLMYHYRGAATPEDRAISVNVIENAVVSGTFAKHGIDAETALGWYGRHKRARQTTMQTLKDVGFQIDEDGSILRVPQFESQTANYLPMIDIDLMHSILKQRDLAIKNRGLSTVYGLSREAIGLADLLQRMFKAAVLMRLGYTIRNGAESQLRIMASTGSLASMSFLGEGMRNAVFNTGKSTVRLVDNVARTTGQMSYKETKDALSGVDAKLAELYKQHDEAAARYEKSVLDSEAPAPKAPEFKSSVLTDEELGSLFNDGVIPERYNYQNDKAYQKDLAGVIKWAKNDWMRSVINDPQHQARVSETAKAFDLTTAEMRLFEKTGQLPTSKVLRVFKEAEDAAKAGVPAGYSTDELSALLSAGDIGAADYDNAYNSLYSYYTSSSIKSGSERIAPSGTRKRASTVKYDAKGNPIKPKPRNYKGREVFTVHWAPQDAESYVRDQVEGFHDDWEQRKIQELLEKFEAEEVAHNEKYAHLVDYTPPVVDAQALSDMNTIRSIIDEKRMIRDGYSKQLAGFEESAKGLDKRKIGNGTIIVRSIDGSGHEFNNAFGGQFADIHRRNASSEASFQNFVDNNSSLYSRNLTHGGYGAVDPTAENYYQAWARTLNLQFGNSAPTMKLIKGDSVEQVAKWMRSDKEGRLVAKRLGINVLDIDEYVARIQGFIDTHVPNAEIRQAMIDGTDITPELLRNSTFGMKDLPTINGPLLKENFNLVSTRQVKNIVNGIYRLIGSMPEDAWARHPLYTRLYKQELQRRFNMWENMNPGETLSTHQIGLLEDVTHKVVLRQVKDTLFTVERKSNMAHYLRFISPFFSAFENTAKTWAKISYAHPETINRANLLYTAPNRAGIATDDKGNIVPVDKASVNDYIWIQVPKQFKNLPFIGKGLSSLDNMGIQKKSLDVVFQGEGMQVPVGPYVGMPVSYIVSKKPELEDSMRWAIPNGPDRNLAMSMMPAWVKRQFTKSGGMDDQQYANTYSLIWMTELKKARDAGKAPTDMGAFAKEVRARTDAYWNMRSVANLVLPFAPQFQSPYKYYIDQWRNYQQKFGKDAKDKFYQDYGDEFFMFSQSLSKNPTGTFAAVGSVQNAKEHADLVATLSGIDPSLISLVTNAGVNYNYSNAAYIWQQRNTLGPNTSEKFRTRQDPVQAEQQNQRDIGWIKFRQGMSGIDAIMAARGLTSLNQKAAADLAAMKKQLIFNIGSNNKDWYYDYLDTNPKTNKVIDGLEAITSNKKFMDKFGNNPTYKSIVVYLQARQQAEQILASRPSHGINSKANADVRLVMDATVSRLKREDPGFGDLYDRWLSYDPVYDLIHSTGATQ